MVNFGQTKTFNTVSINGLIFSDSAYYIVEIRTYLDKQFYNIGCRFFDLQTLQFLPRLHYINGQTLDIKNLNRRIINFATLVSTEGIS